VACRLIFAIAFLCVRVQTKNKNSFAILPVGFAIDRLEGDGIKINSCFSIPLSLPLPCKKYATASPGGMCVGRSSAGRQGSGYLHIMHIIGFFFSWLLCGGKKIL